MLLAGVTFACVLDGCQSASLQDALTTPPQVSSAAKTADTPVASTSPLPGVEDSGAATRPADGARKTVASSRRTHSRHRRQATSRSAAAPAKPAPQAGTATRNATFVEQGAATSGTYPKFVPPKAATSQMSDAEKKKFEDTMAARIKANKQATETPAEAAEREKLLKALAAKHSQDTLKAIDNQ